MSVNAPVTFSNPHNHFEVSQRERIPPRGSLVWPRTLMQKKKKQQTKSITCLHCACVQSFKCLEATAVQFVLKRQSLHCVFDQNIHCSLLFRSQIHVDLMDLASFGSMETSIDNSRRSQWIFWLKTSACTHMDDTR